MDIQAHLVLSPKELVDSLISQIKAFRTKITSRCKLNTVVEEDKVKTMSLITSAPVKTKGFINFGPLEV